MPVDLSILQPETQFQSFHLVQFKREMILKIVKLFDMEVVRSSVP